MGYVVNNTSASPSDDNVAMIARRRRRLAAHISPATNNRLPATTDALSAESAADAVSYQQALALRSTPVRSAHGRL